MYYILIIVVILGILVFLITQIQRILFKLEENTSNAMLQIGVQISSQWEVLNSLFMLIKENSGQGFEFIGEIMAAKSSITKDSFPDDLKKQVDLIAEALKEIVKVAESSPNLKVAPAYVNAIKAMKQYKSMMETSKLIYNDSVRNLNSKIRSFPTLLFANLLGFKKGEHCIN